MEVNPPHLAVQSCSTLQTNNQQAFFVNLVKISRAAYAWMIDYINCSYSTTYTDFRFMLYFSPGFPRFLNCN